MMASLRRRSVNRRVSRIAIRREPATVAPISTSNVALPQRTGYAGGPTSSIGRYAQAASMAIIASTSSSVPWRPNHTIAIIIRTE